MQTLLETYQKALKKNPSAIALDAPDGQLTFEALEQWSNQIAAQIGTTFAGAIVGILFPPSMAYGVALLACMKAGVISQLLEPTNPSCRPEVDSKLPLCLCAPELQNQAMSIAETSIPIGKKWDREIEAPPLKLPPQIEALHLLETSGSSGQPTQVTVGKKTILNHFQELSKSIDYAHGVCHANFARHTRAAWIDNFWLLILSGAGITFFDFHQDSFDTVYKRLQAAAVVNIKSTPTLFEHFVSACEELAPLDSVKHLILGGEPVKIKALKRMAQLLPQDCLFSTMYASTETLQMCLFQSPLAEALKLSKIPSGKPFPSLRIVLLNPENKPVVPGEIGEIVVKSAFLALAITGNKAESRLYLDPENPDLKVFHTGDLGRWDKQGYLECVGRRDRQLKIRGIRVDPLSVEQAIEDIAGIKQAIVLGLELPSSSSLELVAALQREPHQAPNHLIYELLSKQLPGASVPTRYLELECIPKLKSGKVNVKAVEEICRTKLRLLNDPSEPLFESPLRKLLRDLWSQVLGRPIPRHADLFNNEGGDSLRGNQLITELGRKGVPDLDLSWLIQHPTLGTQEQALQKFGAILLEERPTQEPQYKAPLSLHEHTAQASLTDKNRVLTNEDKIMLKNRLGW